MIERKLLEIVDFQKTGKKFNISEWENLDEFQKQYIHLQSSEAIMIYLIHKQYNINSDIYQQYEKQYIQSYCKYFFIKENFINYLLSKNLLNKDGKVQWVLDFNKKEVYIK